MDDMFTMAARTLLHHGRENRLAKAVNTRQINRHDIIPILVRDFGNRRYPSGNCCIVDQNVDPVKFLQRLVHNAPDAPRAGPTST